MSAAIPNPLLKVYDGIFDMLTTGDGNELAAMVVKGNRVSFGTPAKENRNLLKDRPTSADAPELILIDEGGAHNPHVNSSGMSYQQNIALYVSTGDFRYANYASIINWWIIVNMQKWKSALGGLRWNGVSFVTNLTVNSIQIGESNPERNRGFAGFTDIWRFTVEHRIAFENIVYRETVQ